MKINRHTHARRWPRRVCPYWARIFFVTKFLTPCYANFRYSRNWGYRGRKA